jgi:hypothetical protein
MQSTPTSIHPRRLFCSASPVDDTSEIDSTSCLKPSVIAHQEKLIASASRNPPLLLAPSPRSPAVLRTHVEIGPLQEDIDNLVELVKSVSTRLKNGSKIGENITLTSHEGSGIFHLSSLSVAQLEPLRDALEQLVSDLSGGPGEEVNLTVGVQTETNDSIDFVETPKSKSISASVVSGVTDSRMLSADMAHLRTIQKEVRGLFTHEKLVVDFGGSSVTSSCSVDPQTATKISRALGESSEVDLTLSPTTEIFEKVKSNPWFKNRRQTSVRRRSGSLPNIQQDEVVITDSPISTIAPVSGAFPNREILVNDDSMTVSALQGAMARRRAPSVGGNRGGTRDLASWLRKQAGTLDEPNKRRLNNVYRNFPDSSIYRN